MDRNYALTNPVSLVVDKSRQEFNRQDMIKVIETKGIERITFHYTGLDGKLKELKLPITNRFQAERILAEGERVDGSSLFKGMVDVALSDLYVVPCYKTAFLNPFEAGSLDFICRYIRNDGSLAPFALDNILSKAASLFKDNTGFELFALGELEFFLMSEKQTHNYPSPKQKGYHTSAPFLKTGRILDEMVRHITQITGAVKYAHSEVGYVTSVQSNLEEINGKQAEQLEIELLPTPIEETADNLVLARWLIRNTAFKYNCVASFAPKIEEGVAGNGFHVHIELKKNGANVMADKKGKLTPAARKLIGGLCIHADSLTAFGNTVSSAYLRLVPNQEAPTRIFWSDLNRNAMIRVPLAWTNVNNLAHKINPQQDTDFQEQGSRQTVELRTPDGSAIAHLLLAGIAMAAEWGLTEPEAIEIAGKQYVTGNIFKKPTLLDQLTPLPKSCVESASILLDKRELYERKDIFPPAVIEYVANLLLAENDKDINRQLADLAPDDRLYETRKIMHKDLHRH